MRKLIFLCLALLWTGGVAYSCLTSSNSIPTIKIPNIDKLAHFTFHFGFTFIWFLFWKAQLKTTNNYKPLLIVFIASVFFGVFIEIFQELYAPTRSSDVQDVLANIIGATLAIFVILFLNRNKSLDKIFFKTTK